MPRVRVRVVDYNGERFLPLSEAAQRCGVSHVTAFRWAKSKEVAGIKMRVLVDLANRRIYIAESVVEALALARRLKKVESAAETVVPIPSERATFKKEEVGTESTRMRQRILDAIAGIE